MKARITEVRSLSFRMGWSLLSNWRWPKVLLLDALRAQRQLGIKSTLRLQTELINCECVPSNKRDCTVAACSSKCFPLPTSVTSVLFRFSYLCGEGWVELCITYIFLALESMSPDQFTQWLHVVVGFGLLRHSLNLLNGKFRSTAGALQSHQNNFLV